MKPLRSIVFILILATFSFSQTRDFTRWVNPFIGTGGHGHTFPGATLPFGMMQLSPDTRADNWDGSSGYHYSDDIIYGFSHTHLSGTGIPDGCDILVMPRTGDPMVSGAVMGDPASSKFLHTNERAEPGYYSVTLDDGGILAELTATQRVGFHRYTFPNTSKANLVINLKWRDDVIDSKIDTTDWPRVVGYRKSASWAKNQTVYFAAEFSKKPTNAILEISPGFKYEGPKTGSFTGKDIREAFQFDNSDGKPLMLKFAISFVSVEGARKNLEAEIPGWDFDKVRADAKAAWNKELSKIEVSGGTEGQTTNFYTALYHTMIHPNVFNDVDGSYLGHDGKVHVLSPAVLSPAVLSPAVLSPAVLSPGFSRPSAAKRPPEGGTPNPAKRPPEGGTQNSAKRPAEAGTQNASARNPRPKIQNPKSEQYTVFSLWDTFRAAHPLYTIIDQKRTADFINTFIRIYEQGGRLPVWELWGEETDTMIGYHAVSVIADAMAKNIKGFDYEKAYAAAKHSADLDRAGLAAYKRRGYISSEDENESVSKTLEYAYDDWCLMSMASMLFNRRSLGPNSTGSADTDPYLKKLADDIARYQPRAGNFENLFDPETRFFRPRKNGGFIKPFAPEEVTFHFTEGNSWQYSFFVPHDVSRLMQLMGGTTKFVEKLDQLFTTQTKLAGREQPDITGLMGQYAHGNEPSHHIAYLYDYAGVPSKTQQRVRKIMDEFYKPTPDGLIGNEDCGQMSAWYVLSASGFYSVLPGQARYDLGTPLFKEIVYRLQNGKKFIVRAPKVSSTNIYINSAKWNGAKHPASYIVQEQIMAGGVLELDMGDRPNDKAFSSFSTSSVHQDRPAVPVIEGSRIFKDQTSVSIKSLNRNARVVYAVDNDGEEYSRKTQTYTGPFTVSVSSKVEAYAVDPFTGAESPHVEANFRKRTNDWTVEIVSPYSSQYTGGGDEALIDGIRGTTNFASGEWQGYQGKPFEAVIDLRKETIVKELGGSFLQSTGSWIWMPDRIEFEVSNDGVTFDRAAAIKPGFPLREMAPVVREFRQSIAPVKARYVRVRAYNFGKIPTWHPGAGGDPWIFVDEIFID